MATNDSKNGQGKAGDASKSNHRPSIPAGAARPAATSTAPLKRHRRRDPEEEVPAEEALAAAENMKPNVHLPPPNPQPRPAKSSQGMGRLEDPFVDDDIETDTRDARKPAAKRIKVQATQMGYYDHIRRRPGDIFTISGEVLEEDEKKKDANGVERVVRKKGEVAAFSRKWMRRVASNTPERITTVAQSLKQQHDAVQAEKFDPANQDNVNQNPAAKGTGDVDLV